MFENQLSPKFSDDDLFSFSKQKEEMWQRAKQEAQRKGRTGIAVQPLRIIDRKKEAEASAASARLAQQMRIEQDPTLTEDAERTIEFETRFTGQIIGLHGQNIQSLQNQTRTQISVTKMEEVPGKAKAVIKGQKLGVNQAAELIIRIVEEQGMDEDTIVISNKYCGKIIGPQGSEINAMQAKTGASISIAAVPDNPEQSMVVIKGEPASVNQARRLILAITNEPELKLTVDSKYIGELIGPQGQTISNMQEQSSARISVDKIQGNSEKCAIVIRGTSEAIHAAQKLVLQITHRPEKSFVVPRSIVAKIIGPRGETIQALQAESGCRIAVSEAAPNKSRITITANPGTSSTAVELAKESVMSIVNEFNFPEKPTKTVTVADSKAGLIIGPKGKTISRIRDVTKVKIELPDRKAYNPSGQIDVNLFGLNNDMAACDLAEEMIRLAIVQDLDGLMKINNAEELKKYLESQSQAAGEPDSPSEAAASELSLFSEVTPDKAEAAAELTAEQQADISEEPALQQPIKQDDRKKAAIPDDDIVDQELEYLVKDPTESNSNTLDMFFQQIDNLSPQKNQERRKKDEEARKAKNEADKLAREKAKKDAERMDTEREQFREELRLHELKVRQEKADAIKKAKDDEDRRTREIEAAKQIVAERRKEKAEEALKSLKEEREKEKAGRAERLKFEEEERKRLAEKKKTDAENRLKRDRAQREKRAEAEKKKRQEDEELRRKAKQAAAEADKTNKAARKLVTYTPRSSVKTESPKTSHSPKQSQKAARQPDAEKAALRRRRKNANKKRHQNELMEKTKKRTPVESQKKNATAYKKRSKWDCLTFYIGAAFTGVCSVVDMAWTAATSVGEVYSALRGTQKPTPEAAEAGSQNSSSDDSDSDSEGMPGLIPTADIQTNHASDIQTNQDTQSNGGSAEDAD